MPTSSPTYLRPGVFVEESLTTLANVFAQPGVTLPCFMGGHFQGPVTPTKISSWSEFVTRYGGFGDGSSLLAYAAFQYFSGGGRDCWIQRVVGTGIQTSTVTLLDRTGATGVATLTVSANAPGAWGNTVYIDVRDTATGATTGNTGLGDRFDLLVHVGGTDAYSVVERWSDLSMDSSDPRYAPSIINSPDTGSKYIVVTDSTPASSGAGASPAYAVTDAPRLQAGTVLAGAAVSDPAPTTTQMQAQMASGGSLDQIQDPFILNMPGWSDGPTVNAAIAYADPVLGGRGDVFVVADCGQNMTVGAVTSATSPGVGGYTKSSYVAFYYPWLQVNDPRTNSPIYKTVPPGGSVVGLFVRTDTARGIFKPPAGTQFSLTGVISSERRTFSPAELDALNQVGVNTIRNVPGAGYCVMGARTLKTGQSDRYINIRRTLIYMKRAIQDGTRYAIFEPNDQYLWEGLEINISQWLHGLWQQGYLRGSTPQEAFYVKCDADNNPIEKVSQGEVHVEVGVALQYPAEFIVIRIGQTDGSSTATDDLAALAA